MSSAIAGWGRQPPMRRALLGLASSALLVLATVSCADRAATTLTAEGSAGGVVVVTDTRGATDGPPVTITRVASRHDLVEEQRILPQLVQIDPHDPTRLVVRFEGGDPDCYGARLAIDEQPATVRVLVFIGALSPDTSGCSTEVTTVELVTTLTHDLGSRDLIWQR
jgi:hypothetical protein